MLQNYLLPYHLFAYTSRQVSRLYLKMRAIKTFYRSSLCARYARRDISEASPPSSPKSEVARLATRVLSVRAVSAAVAAFTLRLSRARDNRPCCNLRNHPLHRHLARRTSKRGETETVEKARSITPLSSINGLTPNERWMQRNIWSVEIHIIPCISFRVVFFFILKCTDP